jgi:DNA-binding transcriptional LysR family regulator
MHQVRYFLSVAQVLNFTRAAEECNVTQPSLTRAIKQLEDELGGDLFRRERPHAQLTELGERMYPLLKQCYESAVGARALASSFKSGEIGSLRLAISHTIESGLLIPHLKELSRLFDNLEFRLLRGTANEVAEFLKKGEAELGLAAEMDESWERLDRWPLFDEGFSLATSREHRLAGRAGVDFADLRQERFVVRTYCEHAQPLAALLRSRDLDVDHCHLISSERDLIRLLEADLGVAIVPGSVSYPDTLIRVPVNGLELRRTVHLYGVAGRQRSAVASAIMKMLRGADWSRQLNSAAGACACA